MQKTHKGKLYYSFQGFSIVPLFIYGIIIMFFGSYTFSVSMQHEIELELKNVANLTITMLDLAYPGDYKLQGEIAYSLYKGDYNLTGDYTILDYIKEESAMEATLFYEDTRILTTLTDWNGNRIIGTGAPDIVKEEVLSTGTAKFYSNTIISGSTYYSYYSPIFNEDDTCIGMMFVGKPADSVSYIIKSSIQPLLIVGIITMVLSGIVSLLYARQILGSLHTLRNFFSKVSTGSLNETLDSSVLERNDELSEIGRAAIHMQHALRKLVELDALTELYNRRSGDDYLKKVLLSSRENNQPFCLVIGDIDYFKKINDSYGHDCGDIVLKEISTLLKKHMRKKGYAIRWGGEEFLLIYKNLDLEQGLKYLTVLQEDVRAIEYDLNGALVHVTMTFGITCNNTLDSQELLRETDEKLYLGKAQGRDCIIT